MYSEKYLLFSTGGGSADPLNFDRHEMAVYSAKDFRGMRPHNSGTKTIGIDLFFTTDKGREIVTLKIKNGFHSKVMQAISNAIVSGNQSIIQVADVDSNVFINSNIYEVVIKSRDTYTQTLTGNTRVQLAVQRDNYKKCMIANIDASDHVACTLELYDGSDYFPILKAVSIPPKVTLVLKENEIAFDATTYTLHATSGDSGGQLTFTFTY